MAEKLSVKVYYIENRATKEIRKFSIDEDVTSNFEYLIGKIREAFPDLLRKDLLLFWKDDEGDYISVSSDEELVQSLTSSPENMTCLKLYVKVKQTNQPESNEEHCGVTCDGCESSIRGVRHKCTTCFDYDLCSSCEKKGIHPIDHEMLVIKKPRTSSCYVWRLPHGRGFYRDQGPWAGGCRQRCPYQKADSENSTQTTGKQCPIACDPEECKQMISQLAAAFGFDPDVALSSAKVLFENIYASQENSDQTQETGCPNFQEIVKHMAESFGLDPELVMSTAKSFAGNCEKQKKQSEEKQQPGEEKMEGVNGSDTTEDNMEMDSTKSKETFQQPLISLDEMVNEFTKQFTFTQNSAQQEEQNTQQSQPPQVINLGEVIGKLFQGFAPAASSVPTTNNNTETKTEDTKPVEQKPSSEPDFIVVDQTTKEESLSDEQKFEQRVVKALRQMEAMGFDNDGGWLRQLLISKDLNIGRVLDALNPSV